MINTFFTFFILFKNYLRNILFIIILFLSSFFTNCTKVNFLYPIYSNENKFDFVPGNILIKDKSTIFVASENSNRLYEIDINTLKIRKTIISGMMPLKMKIFNKKLYIANYLSHTITEYDLISGTQENFSSGGLNPSAIDFNKEKNLLYVSNMGSNNISIIDLNLKSIKNKIKVGQWPSDIYFDGKFIYICCKYTNTIEMIDAENEKLVFTKIQTGISPVQMIPINKKEIAILNEWEYIFNYKSTIILFDKFSYKINSSIKVDGGIFNGVLTKSKKYLIVTVPQKDKVIFINLQKKSKIHELNLEDDIPKYVAISEDGKLLFIATQNSQKIITVLLRSLS